MRYYAFVFLIVLSTLTVASSLAGVNRGTDGLTPIPVDIANGSDTDISCKVSLAHWFADDVGRAGPGERVTGTLWFDRHNGTLYFLNALEDRMPVERLWCGPAGNTWQNRFEVVLRRKAGQDIKPIQLKCAAQDGVFTCEPN